MKRWRATFDAPNESATVDQTHGDLDEVAIGEWLHAEHMGSGRWFASIAGHCFWVEVRRGIGRITSAEIRAVVTPRQRAANRRRAGLPPERRGAR